MWNDLVVKTHFIISFSPTETDAMIHICNWKEYVSFLEFAWLKIKKS